MNWIPKLATEKRISFSPDWKELWWVHSDFDAQIEFNRISHNALFRKPRKCMTHHKILHSLISNLQLLHFVVVIHALPVAIKARQNFRMLHLHPDRQTTSHKLTELKGYSQTIRCQIQQQQKILFFKKTNTTSHSSRILNEVIL